MKLHLPRLLSAALLAAFVSAPVYSASIPEGYNPREIYTPDALTVLNNTKPTGFLLANGTYAYSRNDPNAEQPFYNGPSLFFTSAPEQSSVKMIFTGGYTKAFSDVHALTFADMNRLEFSSMRAGVIYSWGNSSSLTISGVTDGKSGNWDVEFLENSIKGNSGGAIDADKTCVSIDYNGGVRFSENEALAQIVSSGNQNQGNSGNQNQESTGGAGVSANSAYAFSLFGLNLSFEFGFNLGFSYEKEDNPKTPEVEQKDICGGAINLVDSTLSMKENQDVTFTYNSAVDYGGAIFASPGINSIIEISQNGQVLFQENRTAGHVQNDHVVGGGGGAIFIGSQGSLVMDGNTGAIIFKKNLAAAAGGAIYHGGQSFQNEGSSLALTNNTGNISFEGNIASGTGGAIHMQQGGRLEMSHNAGIISFDHNEAGVSGGAISALNAFVTLNHNSEVLFGDNIVFRQMIDGDEKDSFSSYYVGGAIYGSNIQIHNNELVLFRRNAEIVADDYFRLRSLYVEGTTQHLEVSLSAGKGQSIEFHDSIYIDAPELHLNSSYADIPQVGDIIFTGETTVEDLEMVKSAWKEKGWNTQNVTTTATDKEIEESRTSIVLGETYLNGGRLRVEKGAIFKSCGIFLNNGSKSTLRLFDGKFVNIDASGNTSDSSGASLYVGTGTTLEILGHSAIEGGQLTFADGAKWSFTLDQTHAESSSSAALTFNGQLNIDGSLTIILNVSDADMKHRYKLYEGTYESYMDIKSHWTAGNIKVAGTGDAADVCFDDLVWEYGTLYYVSTLMWNNGKGEGNGEWNLSDTNWGNGIAFEDGMKVRFSNTGAGTVTLTDELRPGLVKVANTNGHDYTFTGQANDKGVVGKLSGPTDLVKSGDGALTLDLANDYSGTTKLEEGALNLHDDNALGTSTLSTAENTTLRVGDGAEVELKDGNHFIKGAVEVAEGSSLEIASGSYKASSSTVDGKLIINGQDAMQAGSLSGSGTLEVTNGAYVAFTDASGFGTGTLEVTNGASATFWDASGFHGNVSVTGSSSSIFLKIADGILRAGELAVNAGDLTLRASEQLTMAGGSVLSMVAGTVAEKVTTVLADKVIEFAGNAILSAMLNGMLGDLDKDGMLNEGVGGAVGGAGITLNAGSTLKLENCHIGMYRNNAESATLTLNVTPTDAEKINLVLLPDDILTEDSVVQLFSGADTVNFVYDGTIISGNGYYECDANHYFTGSMVGADTKLVYSNGNVYMKGLVPEPTTATLSLLALAALATRRRRR